MNGFVHCLLLPCGLGLLIDLSPAQAGGVRREAEGWLQLEQDQRLHRETVTPGGLAPRRDLDARERTERLELRALQQQQRREDRLRVRPDRAAPRGAGGSPSGTVTPRQHRRLDGLRLDQQRARAMPRFERR